jgi:hypothetical protein
MTCTSHDKKSTTTPLNAVRSFHRRDYVGKRTVEREYKFVFMRGGGAAG